MTDDGDGAIAKQTSLDRQPYIGTGIGSLLGGPSPLGLTPFVGAGTQAFTPEQCTILGRALTDDEIAIRPDDGNLYFPGVRYRRRLNEAFGMGGWALVPVGDPGRDEGGKNPVVYYTGRLYVGGRYIAQAMGKGTFFLNSGKSDYGTALESARTDCLTRCVKDFIAMELWDPTFATAWRDKHCRRIKNPDRNRFGNVEWVWLRKDDPVFLPPPPNVPKRATERETGNPIVGNWPHPVRDPVAEAERAALDDYRQAMGQPARSDLEIQLQRSIDANIIEVTDKKTGEVTREVKATRPQLAKIHILLRELNMSDEQWRWGLKAYYEIESADVMTRAQADDAIERLLGAKARVPEGMLHVVPTDETTP